MLRFLFSFCDTNGKAAEVKRDEEAIKSAFEQVQKLINEEIASKETTDKEVVDKEVVDKEVVDEEVVNKKVPTKRKRAARTKVIKKKSSLVDYLDQA